MVNSNETTSRMVRYFEEGDVFKSAVEFQSELTVHHKRRGVQYAQFSVINNAYCVTSFNVTHTALSQTEGMSQTCLVIFDL